MHSGRKREDKTLRGSHPAGPPSWFLMLLSNRRKLSSLVEKWLDRNLGTEKEIHMRNMEHLVISERKGSLKAGYNDGRGQGSSG